MTKAELDAEIAELKARLRRLQDQRADLRGRGPARRVRIARLVEAFDAGCIDTDTLAERFDMTDQMVRQALWRNGRSIRRAVMQQQREAA